MPYFSLAAVLCSLLLLHGCSPALNWRAVHLEKTTLTALFPCKPNQETRAVSLGANASVMTMLACDADNATFTLAYADIQDEAMTGEVLEHWRAATLGNIRASTASNKPFVLKGVQTLPQSVQVLANGVRTTAAVVTVEAVWFAVGSHIFQAAVYAETPHQTAAETYFSGLQLP